MSNVARTRRLTAIAVVAASSLVGVAACTKAVDGSGTYVGEGPKTSSSSSSSSSADDSDDSSSSDSDSSSSSGSSEEDPQSPDGAVDADTGQTDKYDNDVEIKIDSAAPFAYSGLLSDEEGRQVFFTLTNPAASGETLQMSDFLFDADVYCGSGFNSHEYLLKTAAQKQGPDELAPGQASQYEIPVALKKEDIGSKCLISIKFTGKKGDGSEIGYNLAKFSYTLK